MQNSRGWPAACHYVTSPHCVFGGRSSSLALKSCRPRTPKDKHGRRHQSAQVLANPAFSRHPKRAGCRMCCLLRRLLGGAQKAERLPASYTERIGGASQRTQLLTITSRGYTRLYSNSEQGRQPFTVGSLVKT
jgi:hypothetical protein